ncbi:hypothetical protein [Microseira wollei]|uniref:Uncharacterized protein n=1 Tax=Microseira wollei NIES-4236 TaxID=2530354 RepID=A0AAV3WMG2_9CYAN|nr:hypothetical protein [Microseira wollei]GET42654.1 hypothetical protein MiSe_74720 [Microseira wollei NIES-4236]
MSFDFIPDDGGIPTPKYACNTDGEPSPGREPIEMLLIASPQAINRTILHLYKRGFAEVSAWSRLLPTGKPGKMIGILCRQIPIS